MNASPLTLTPVRVAAVLALLSGVAAYAGEGSAKAGGSLDGKPFVCPPETQRDMGAGYERLHEEAMRILSDPNANAKVFKFDLDTDINHDGRIDEYDNGWLEYTPPGMVMKVGTTAQVHVTVSCRFPFYPGSAVARLSVAGINRGIPTGEFASLDEEIHSTAHVIVWADAGKTHKLLDSADPGKRIVEWIVHPGYQIPGHSGVPNNVYVEAISPSGQFVGDVRLMGTMEPLPPAPGEKGYNFRASEDHILFTVTH